MSDDAGDGGMFRGEAGWAGFEPWEPGSFLAGIDATKQKLREAGVRIDIKRALASLEDDDDE